MSERNAIIENGLVVNVVVGSPEISENQILVECPNAGPGWKYIDGQFVEPEPQLVVPPPAPTKEELLVKLQALQDLIQSLQ
jgi:hypothetical protein